jgi:hypothetical protein
LPLNDECNFDMTRCCLVVEFQNALEALPNTNAKYAWRGFNGVCMLVETIIAR